MNLRAQKGIIERKLIRKSPFSVGYYNFQPAVLTSNYPAQMPQDLADEVVLQWSDPGDVVLDPMCGSGTVLKAAVKSGRRAIGFDVNPNAIRICEESPELTGMVVDCDARAMKLGDNHIDLILTSPPYGTLIAGKKLSYSSDPRDLSNAKTYEEFLDGLIYVLKECFRVLKPGALAVFIAKSRNKGILRPLPHYISIFGGMRQSDTFTINGKEYHGVGFWPWTHRVFPTLPYMIWTFGPENRRKAIPQHEEMVVLRKPSDEEPLEEEPQPVPISTLMDWVA